MTWWAYDIETESWDTLVLATALSDDGRIFRMTTPDQCAAWYKSLPKDDLIWAHNGGNFDYIQLIDACRDLDWTARMAGSAIVSCRARGYAECRDTTRIFQTSLAKWTGRKEELGLPCICNENCAGYCSIRRDMPRSQFRRLEEYNLQDCRALLDTLREDLLRLEGEGLAALDHRGLPRLTFGSIAWHTAAGLAGIDPRQAIESGDYAAGRAAYFGGRCEVGQIEAARGERYDKHAAYPWALTLPVPAGIRRSLRDEEARRAWDAGAPGIYHAGVTVRDCELPPLPHRYIERHSQQRGRLTRDRLLWATGELVGHWTDHELRYAVEAGARIDYLDGAHVWSDFLPLWQPYCEHIYAARDLARARGDDRWASVLKWFANALSGKLAQRPEASTLRVTDTPEEELREGQAWFHVAGRLWAQTTSRVPPNARPHQAAYLTSRVRVKLLERLRRHEGSWLYCDTDSTYVQRLDPIGVDPSELGTFGYEGPALDWTALAPKLYRYRDETGKPTVRARGVPFRRDRDGGLWYTHVTVEPGEAEEALRTTRERRPAWDLIDTLRDGARAENRVGVERLRGGRGAFVAREVKRSWRDAGADRCGTRYVLPTGRTRPLHRKRDGTYI